MLVGKPQIRRLISAVRPAVRHEAVPVEAPDVEAERVPGAPAITQSPGRLEHRDAGSSPNGSRIEIRVPPSEVLYRREDAAIADDVQLRNADRVAAGLVAIAGH